MLEFCLRIEDSGARRAHCSATVGAGSTAFAHCARLALPAERAIDQGDEALDVDGKIRSGVDTHGVEVGELLDIARQVVGGGILASSTRTGITSAQARCNLAVQAEQAGLESSRGRFVLPGQWSRRSRRAL